MADPKLPQKTIRENPFKRIVTRLVLLAFLNQNLAFATNINLDFKDSQTPQRLHVIPRMSNVGDVSHLEIDTEQKQAVVYLKEKREEALDELEKHSSQGGDVPVTTKPVILQKHEIINLPWDLEPEKLTLFILNHTAWLSPLSEDGYKLEFKGRLLGGMKKSGGNIPTVTVTNFTVDCQGRNDWPKGTIGDKFCKNNGNGSGNFGVNVINKPYVPPVDKEWQQKCEKALNPFGNQKAPYILPLEDKKPDLKKVNVNPVKAPVIKIDDKKIHQAVAKDVEKVMQPLVNKRKAKFRHVFEEMPDIIMEELVPYRGGELPKKTLDGIISNVSWRIDGLLKDTDLFKLYWRDGTIKLEKGRWCPDIVDAMSHTGVLSAYAGLKKQYAEELEKFKKKQEIEEIQLKKLNQEKHKEEVKSLSQKFMRQERGFADIKTKMPFKQNGKESIYKGFSYNVEFPLSPLELEACQGKTVCLYSHLKTDTPDVCRVQVVAFKGNVVVGGACSDAMPSGKWGYLFTALHFDFKDYDSVWLRPLRTGGKQDSMISAWSYSTWITDIPLSQKETSHVKVVQNSQKTISFSFPDSPLVYPCFSKDRTTAESFLLSKSYSLDTGNRLFQEFLTDMAAEEGSSSFQTALAVTPYIKNHVLQHAPFKDKGFFPDLKTSSQSLLMMAVEALYGDSPQKFLDQSKIFYTKAIPFQELSKAYQTHHEILGHMLPTSWQEMIKKQGKTALTPHSDSLAKWSILHDVATEMGRQCGIPVPSVFSTLDVVQSITKAGFEFFALEPEDRKIFCQQFDGFGQSLCAWLDYNFEPLFDGVLLLTTKGQGKGVPVKWPQLKPKIQLKLEMKAQPKPQRIVNPPRAESPVWQSFKNHKNGIKKNGESGKNERFYEWDNKHNDIEVYGQKGIDHLGTMDPVTGKMIKPPVPGRTIKEKV